MAIHGYPELIPVTPDMEGLRRNLKREGALERVYYFEHGIANNIKDKVASIYNLEEGVDKCAKYYEWKREIRIHRFLGYDVFRVFLPKALDFNIQRLGDAGWVDEHAGPIQSWEDFEKFPWPKVEEIDFTQLEWYEKNLPPNMGLTHKLGVWEIVSDLFGFESFCFKVYEEEALVDAVFEKVGAYNLWLAKQLTDFDCTFSLYGMDDLGFKTSLLLSPDIIRELIVPWHVKLSETAHESGKMYFFHCCGKLDAIMEDIIDHIKVDAKHSFEDVIEPVTSIKQRYGKRLSLLGGMDVDFLARSDEAAVRRKVRETLEICMKDGGYCLGAGNWITDYIPVENYLAMIDEGRKFVL